TAGQTVPQAYDSMIAKLIITGATRREALQRAARALGEFEVGGMPTVLQFHRAVLADPAFSCHSFSVHTRWIETEFSADLPSQDQATLAGPADRTGLTVEVGGKRLEVTVPRGTSFAPAAAPGPVRRASRRTSAPAAGGDALISPMQGTIISVAVTDSQRVSAGQPVVVLEAMKMEQPLTAHKDGIVTSLSATVGQTVTTGATICRIEG
ncbi:MAG TPA: biotin/lipoyl-containing protein, partial [Streptosporangiaceae bacterium]|nr:biotin/lipoyl-containing protein [Streptosporangiaceae bacterium]